jgi:hypothetical protein
MRKPEHILLNWYYLYHNTLIKGDLQSIDSDRRRDKEREDGASGPHARVGGDLRWAAGARDSAVLAS